MQDIVFLNKIKESFQRVKIDMTALKENLQSWISYLYGNQEDMKAEITALTLRIEQLERKIERNKVKR